VAEDSVGDSVTRRFAVSDRGARLIALFGVAVGVVWLVPHRRPSMTSRSKGRLAVERRIR
jgi:hypothetical protein